MNIVKCLSTAFYIDYICEYEFFENYAMLSFFFRSVLAKHNPTEKNNPTEKQFEAKITKRH